MNILSLILVTLALLTPTYMRAAPNQIEADNGLIALPLKDPAGNLQIFTIHSDGTNPRQLTFEWDNGRPVWSRDGKKIVYTSTSSKGMKVFVTVMNADGSNQKTLCEGEAPDWSPDGKTISFNRNWQIWTIDADGTNERQITHSATAKRGPSWSPDGKQMVFILVRNTMSPHDFQPQIGIINADGTNEGVLTREPRMTSRINPDGTKSVREEAPDANAPSWSPVSDEIAFWSGMETRGGDVWVIHSDGTGSRQLTGNPNSDDPTWSPDGRKIIFSTGRGGKNELWIMDKDGGNQKKLHDIDAFPFPGRASWQPIIGTK
jgi:TolB protein